MRPSLKIAIVALAFMSATQLLVAQRGMRLGGGGGMRSGGAPMRMSAAPIGRAGVPVTSGVVGRGFVPINSGFVGAGGVRFRGGVAFGHNPRFRVGFGSGFGHRFGHRFGPGFGNPCFRTGFCGGFAGSTFFNGGVPVIGYYPYPYSYPIDYAQSYSDYAQPSQYAVVQGENQYAEAYQQGATAQQVVELTNEVEHLRSEMDAREREGAAARPKTEAAVQELPLNATLVFRNGRRMQIHNYAIVGQTIWIFDEQTAKKMSLAQLDLNATKRVNEENGVLFLLPGMR